MNRILGMFLIIQYFFVIRKHSRLKQITIHENHFLFNKHHTQRKTTEDINRIDLYHGYDSSTNRATKIKIPLERAGKRTSSQSHRPKYREAQSFSKLRFL